jgi:transposase
MVLLGFEDETWLYLRPYITNTYMMKGEQQNILYNGANKKVNAFITLLYPSNKVKFKISKSRTSQDFIDHLRNVKRYVKNNRVKRFILVIDNASFHVSRKTTDFLNKQTQWLTVRYLPKRSPNLNPVETKVNRNLKKDICANHNYQSEENLIVAVTKYLKSIGSWRRL